MYAALDSYPKSCYRTRLREIFEQYGLGTMQTLLAIGDFLRRKGETLMVRDFEGPLLSWLTEQYDRAE
jgi:hypothetical protein